MNTKQKIGLASVAAMALAVSYWIGYVHGSGHLALLDVIISTGLAVIFVLTIAKLAFAWFFRRGSLSPSRGGPPPPTAPSPGVPVPRPPGAPPEIYREHAAW